MSENVSGPRVGHRIMRSCFNLAATQRANYRDANQRVEVDQLGVICKGMKTSSTPVVRGALLQHEAAYFVYAYAMPPR